MYSKARILGHPIHPMLVAVPIGMFVATIGAELAHIGTQDPFYYRAAMVANVTGVIAALIAAIPGAIDLFSLPRASAARRTGIKHAGLNVLTVVVFAVSAGFLYAGWSARVMVRGEWNLDAHIPLAIDAVGLVVLTIAGALGFAMVQTHHVGVKPAALLPERAPAIEKEVVVFEAPPATGTEPPPLHH
jgi:uncharacterized membrane protein